MNKIIYFGDIELYTESFGSKENPAILLIMGACSSMLWWEEEFCYKLAKKGFFVIRYDLRDTGKSTTYLPLKPEYTFFDLAEDAIQILNAYDIERSIIMGMSMGGLIAQIIATKHPDRVNGIILLASAYIKKESENLKGEADSIEKFLKEYEKFKPESDEEILEYAFKQWETTNKSSRPHDEKHIKEMIKLDFERAIDYNSRLNHFFVKLDEDAMDYLSKINEIKVPALIVHGTEDVVVPFKTGKMLSEDIKGSVFFPMEGAGHEINSEDYDSVASKINEVFKEED